MTKKDQVLHLFLLESLDYFNDCLLVQRNSSVPKVYLISSVSMLKLKVSVLAPYRIDPSLIYIYIYI